MSPAGKHLVRALAEVARAAQYAAYVNLDVIVDEIEAAILHEEDSMGEEDADDPSELLLNPGFDPEVWSRKIGEEALSALNVPAPTHGKGDPWPGIKEAHLKQGIGRARGMEDQHEPVAIPVPEGPAQEIALVYPARMGRTRIGARVPATFSTDLADGTITFNLTETVTLTAEEADPYAIELYQFGERMVQVYLSTFGIGRTVGKGDTITLTPPPRPSLPHDDEEDGA